MSDFKLSGTITALVTPFNEDLSIDFEAYEKLIEFQIDGGIDGILVFGSTGEGATLSSSEKISLLVKAVEISNGRVPIIAGTGSNNTRATIDLTLVAKEYGAAAALIVAPYYNKPSQEGLYHHFLAVSENVDLPQIIYNIPGRTGVNIEPETQLKIAEDCDNVIATKEASGNLEQMMEVMKYAPDGFALFSGDDSIAVPVVAMGGEGVISVLSNYMPKQFSQTINLALQGELGQARLMHYDLFDLMQLNFIETNPVPVKAILSLMGYIQNICRMPLLPIIPENFELLKNFLATSGLVEAESE